ncbi:hypothetical protein L1987_15462 [Smallanthus sonchifolius]|uniref:Uncharacterized protein n=1 Tax=Smallanthus sonchifolius TaxID=185202 RepID=A0ACB9J886_9ASTR|nr:hypothetical protein L1987_15462 [Smallanthus sonchifolius]
MNKLFFQDAPKGSKNAPKALVIEVDGDFDWSTEIDEVKSEMNQALMAHIVESFVNDEIEKVRVEDLFKDVCDVFDEDVKDTEVKGYVIVDKSQSEEEKIEVNTIKSKCFISGI